ncbi:MAG: hypothetical protein ACRC5F_00930 [Cetobacterium sp.]
MKKVILMMMLAFSFSLKAEWKMGSEVDKFNDVIDKMCYAESYKNDGYIYVFKGTMTVVIDGIPKINSDGFVEMSFKMDGSIVYDVLGKYEFREGKHQVWAPTTGDYKVEQLLLEVSKSNYMKIAIEKDNGYIYILDIDNKGATKCFREIFK